VVRKTCQTAKEPFREEQKKKGGWCGRGARRGGLPTESKDVTRRFQKKLDQSGTARSLVVAQLVVEGRYSANKSMWEGRETR